MRDVPSYLQIREPSKYSRERTRDAREITEENCDPGHSSHTPLYFASVAPGSTPSVSRREPWPMQLKIVRLSKHGTVFEEIHASTWR